MAERGWTDAPTRTLAPTLAISIPTYTQGCPRHMGAWRGATPLTSAIRGKPGVGC